LEIGCFNKAIGKRTTPKAIINGISNCMISRGTCSGYKKLTKPMTDKILNKFDPIILPTEIPCSL
jgi:hypothetical protein